MKIEKNTWKLSLPSGYPTLLNTNMKPEKEHFARFLHTAKDYTRKNSFKDTSLIESKPIEPPSNSMITIVKQQSAFTA